MTESEASAKYPLPIATHTKGTSDWRSEAG